jgi:hypothetical protein
MADARANVLLLAFGSYCAIKLLPPFLLFDSLAVHVDDTLHQRRIRSGVRGRETQST